MPVLMSAADCLVLTSAIEGSPNVVKEAVTVGLPVVATPSGDVREVLGPVEPSWVTDATPDAVGAALAECLRRRERSDGRTTGAWLDERRIAERLLAVYADSAGVPVVPSPAAV
jgi:glycosyltransferase involved in cell wall biosynthesis